jgi:DNA-binding transcriptional LysR family regulator
MELRHLRYFVAVAEAGSVTRAAERLGMQQPPLGQQIRLLEKELGVALFDRLPKRIVLNGAGKLFLQEAQTILRSVDEAAEHVRRFHRGEQGRLALGFTSSASLHGVTPRLIRTFREAYPLVKIEVDETETFGLILAVQQKRIDAALIHIEPTRFPDLTSIVLANEQFTLAIPRDHPLADTDTTPTLKSLEGQNLVVYRRTDGPGIFDVITAALHGAGVTPVVVDEVQRMVAALNLVAAGRGLTVVPESMDVLHTSHIVYRRMAAHALPSLPLFLVHRRLVDIALVQNFIAAAKTIVSPAAV